ncbi:MAG: guanylate kinase [Faecousia sp.]
MGEGKLIVLSGASGVGKGTVLNQMMKLREDLSLSVSATTRSPRPAEQEGVHYYFVTPERFREMIENDELLEYDAHMGSCYGTPWKQLEEKRSHGPVILDIDPKGARIVKDKIPDAVLVFIMPPSMAELEQRLRGRNDTSEEQIRLRLQRAEWEMDQRGWYDHVVVNDDARRCAGEILSFIQ